MTREEILDRWLKTVSHVSIANNNRVIYKAMDEWAEIKHKSVIDEIERRIKDLYASIREDSTGAKQVKLNVYEAVLGLLKN